MVLNPSFEIYSSCPSNIGQINKATGWSSFANTPDYFNACGGPGFSIPSNAFGYQNAASGNAYAGFGNYMSEALYPGNYREYIGGTLSSPLLVAVKYYISFKVSLSLNSLIPSTGASNKMGVNFSTVPYNTSNPAQLVNSAAIFSQSIIADSIGWVRVLGSFVSDSAYQHIIIGNFFANTLTDTLILTNDTVCASYYYLEDVCVSTDSLFASTFNTGIQGAFSPDNISIYPNPTVDKIYIDCDDNLDIMIFDGFGQQVLYKALSNNHSEIDLSQFEKGIFCIQILHKGRIIRYKILKQ